MTPGELLERIAVRLETTGWTRGHFGGPEGPNCWAGAMALECPANDPQSASARLQARAAMRQVIRSLGSVSIVGWNDTVCADQEEAVDTVRRAAEWLAGERTAS